MTSNDEGVGVLDVAHLELELDGMASVLLIEEIDHDGAAGRHLHRRRRLHRVQQRRQRVPVLRMKTADSHIYGQGGCNW